MVLVTSGADSRWALTAGTPSVTRGTSVRLDGVLVGTESSCARCYWARRSADAAGAGPSAAADPPALRLAQ